MQIREETEKDQVAVHHLNVAAFGTPLEADLVDVLRKEASPIISLLAEGDGMVIGHILFSPVALTNHKDLKIMGLGPMAVLPDRQRQGVGSALVREGLMKCKALGYGAVVVLGHPGYYPRFGFVPSARYGIVSEYEVPEDVFMVLELEPGYLRQAEGIIQYHPAFNQI
jgi:putative acetyltransferase